MTFLMTFFTTQRATHAVYYCMKQAVFHPNRKDIMLPFKRFQPGPPNRNLIEPQSRQSHW